MLTRILTQGPIPRVEIARREVCVPCVGMGVVKGGATLRCTHCNGTGGTRRLGDECRECHGSDLVRA